MQPQHTRFAALINKGKRVVKHRDKVLFLLVPQREVLVAKAPGVTGAQLPTSLQNVGDAGSLQCWQACLRLSRANEKSLPYETRRVYVFLYIRIIAAGSVLCGQPFGMVFFGMAGGRCQQHQFTDLIMKHF